MSWRDRAKPIITEVLERVKESPRKEQKKALREAYPFGERKFWPYKVWLSEIKRQREGWTPYDRKKKPDPNQIILPFPLQMTISGRYGEIEIK